jgi:hypothetical protein
MGGKGMINSSQKKLLPSDLPCYIRCITLLMEILFQVSGLDKNMASSDHPLKYSHLDIAGSSGGLPHPTTGSAVTALVMQFLAK